jgi:hypothetical protein
LDSSLRFRGMKIGDWLIIKVDRRGPKTQAKDQGF